MASRTSTRPFRRLTSSPVRQDAGWQVNLCRSLSQTPVMVKSFHLTQSNKSKKDTEEEQQAEQEAQEPLPPAAAGAQAKTGLFHVFYVDV